jgi:hypothetical protein
MAQAWSEADELILYSGFYRLEDRLHLYEIIASLILKPAT